MTQLIDSAYRDVGAPKDFHNRIMQTPGREARRHMLLEETRIALIMQAYGENVPVHMLRVIRNAQDVTQHLMGNIRPRSYANRQQ